MGLIFISIRYLASKKNSRHGHKNSASEYGDDDENIYTFIKDDMDQPNEVQIDSSIFQILSFLSVLYS